MLFWSVFSFVIVYSQAQVLLNGACPNVPVQRAFSPEKFMGTWYEFERFYTDSDVHSKCTKLEFTKNFDGRTSIISASIHQRTGRPLVSHGVASFDYGDLSRMTVQLSPRSNSPAPNSYPYWILDTDYLSYAVVFSCQEFCGETKHSEIVWILGRTAVVPDDTLRRIYRKLAGFGIDAKRLMKVEQKNCVNVAVQVRSHGSPFAFDRNSARRFLSALTNQLV